MCYCRYSGSFCLFSSFFFSFPTGLDDFMEGTKSFIYLRFDSPDGFECDVFGVFVDFF